MNRLYKIQFSELMDDDGTRIGRAMCYVTAPGPFEIESVVRSCCGDDKPLPAEFIDADFSVVQEFLWPENGEVYYSVSVGAPRPCVSTLLISPRVERPEDLVPRLLALYNMHQNIQDFVRMMAFKARYIDPEKARVW